MGEDAPTDSGERGHERSPCGRRYVEGGRPRPYPCLRRYQARGQYHHAPFPLRGHFCRPFDFRCRMGPGLARFERERYATDPPAVASKVAPGRRSPSSTADPPSAALRVDVMPDYAPSIHAQRLAIATHGWTVRASPRVIWHYVKSAGLPCAPRRAGALASPGPPRAPLPCTGPRPGAGFAGRRAHGAPQRCLDLAACLRAGSGSRRRSANRRDCEPGITPAPRSTP